MTNITVGDVLIWDEKILRLIFCKSAATIRRFIFGRRKKPPEL